MEYLLLGLVAIPIGWIASMIGVGGGIFMVPLLMLFYLDKTQVAVGTSLTAIVFNSISSTIGYSRQNIIDFKFGLKLMPSAIVGVLIGSYLTEHISSDGLAVAFGIILIYVAILMLWGKAPKDLAEKLQRRTVDGDANPSLILIGVVGLIAGVASGFFGIGGGIVMVPAMTFLLGADILVAVSISLFVMGPIALIGALEHGLLLDNVRLEYAIPLAVGIMIGAQLGSYTAGRVPKVWLRRGFGVVLLYSAYRMIALGINL